MTLPFERFGPPHLAVIALTFATPFFLAAVVRWSDSAAVARAASWFLVGLLVGAKTLMLVFLARDGELTIANAAQCIFATGLRWRLARRSRESRTANASLSARRGAFPALPGAMESQK
jgi:hypothetical protein